MMSAFTNSALSAADVFKVALIGNSSLTAPEVLPATLEVDAAHPGAKVNPMFSGLMIEEINHSLDGGLYGELIQNRVLATRLTAPTSSPAQPWLPTIPDLEFCYLTAHKIKV
jgi:hypothetical protein